MASKVVYTDDIEPTLEADAGTITFMHQGNYYEIDLSRKNATKLASQLGPWIAAARSVSKTGTKIGAKKGGAPSGYNTDQLNAIREWANRNGYTVSNKGRIAGDIIHAFEQAQTAPKTELAV